jgi:hypothetical protein
MRQLLVINNRDAFASAAQQPGVTGVPHLARAALVDLPAHASILTQDRGGWFGRRRGGKAWVMQSGNVVATVSVSGADVQRGWIEVG